MYVPRSDTRRIAKVGTLECVGSAVPYAVVVEFLGWIVIMDVLVIESHNVHRVFDRPLGIGKMLAAY